MTVTGKHHHHKDLDAYGKTSKLEKEHVPSQPAAQDAEVPPASQPPKEQPKEPAAHAHPHPHPSAPDAAGEKVVQLEARVAELQAKLSTAEDKLLRVLAEQDNIRRRAARDKADAAFGAQFETLSALIHVLDHFELAVASGQSSDNFQALLEGMRMIGSEFQKALKDIGVETISAVGQPFDPKIHESIGEEESKELAEGLVIKQWRSGYKVGDRVIRPAAVIISKGPGAAPAEAAAGGPPTP